MLPNQYLEAIARECSAFSEVLENSPNVEVPTCPGWNVADVAVHLGIIHRWAAELVRTGATEPIRDREVRFGLSPNSPQLASWFRTGATELMDALSSMPPGVPVWSWISDSTVEFWQRRQAHEAAIHRWDVQAAIGQQNEIDATLAADGIDEWLYVFALGRSRATSVRAGSGESFHFHCTDATGEWVVRFIDNNVEVQREHARADVAVRGAASDLELFLWGRQPSDHVEVLGNASLLSRWPELLPST